MAWWGCPAWGRETVRVEVLLAWWIPATAGPQVLLGVGPTVPEHQWPGSTHHPGPGTESLGLHCDATYCQEQPCPVRQPRWLWSL